MVSKKWNIRRTRNHFFQKKLPDSFRSSFVWDNKNFSESATLIFMFIPEWHRFGSSKIEVADHNLFDQQQKIVLQAICFPIPSPALQYTVYTYHHTSMIEYRYLGFSVFYSFLAGSSTKISTNIGQFTGSPTRESSFRYKSSK
jgi:hypothetical protein